MTSNTSRSTSDTSRSTSDTSLVTSNTSLVTSEPSSRYLFLDFPLPLCLLRPLAASPNA